MGDSRGVGEGRQTVTLYTSQRDEVAEILRGRGAYYVQTRFIREKYGEVAHLFLAVYQWYAGEAARHVPRPPQAQSAVWAFPNREDVAPREGCKILTLRVPVEEALFFDMLEWSEILNFRYLGDEKARRAYAQTLRMQGIDDPSAVVTTPFYPLLKRELLASWQALFRHDQPIKKDRAVLPAHPQAGLWRILPEWVAEIA